MERDFLGISTRKSEPPPVRDDEREPRENSEIYGNPTVNLWPFANITPARQNNVSFSTQPDEKSSKFTPVITSQNSMHGSQSNGAWVLPLSMNQNSFGGIPTANRGHPVIADLTIFYAGKVMFFENVPIEKAGEIVRLANTASNTSSKMTPNPTVTNGILSPTMVHSQNSKLDHASLPPQPPPPSVSTEISLAPQTGMVSTAGTSRTTNESLTCGTQSDALRPNASRPVPQAIPQARKASLSRFLEKRKERVTAATPYPFTKKSLENNFPGKSSENHFPGKSSENIIPENSRNREESTGMRI